jgi:hypothetical protein
MTQKMFQSKYIDNFLKPSSYCCRKYRISHWSNLGVYDLPRLSSSSSISAKPMSDILLVQKSNTCISILMIFNVIVYSHVASTLCGYLFNSFLKHILGFLILLTELKNLFWQFCDLASAKPRPIVFFLLDLVQV